MTLLSAAQIKEKIEMQFFKNNKIGLTFFNRLLKEERKEK
jgi:hypothetical protein